MKAGCIIALLLGLMTASVARADNKAAAREAFREGSRQFELGDLKAALAAFKTAYLSYEDPAFLFNIAQCQRQLGDKAGALRTYRIFLAKTPDGRDRQQVERIVAELQAAIDQDRAATTHPPIGPMTESSSASHDEAASHDETPTEVAKSDTKTTLPAPQPLERHRDKRKWIWGFVAGGAVVVAGAITLGVVLGTRNNNFIELRY